MSIAAAFKGANCYVTSYSDRFCCRGRAGDPCGGAPEGARSSRDGAKSCREGLSSSGGNPHTEGAIDAILQIAEQVPEAIVAGTVLSVEQMSAVKRAGLSSPYHRARHGR